MKKTKILVSTALALCVGATAVIPAFATEKFTFTKIGDYDSNNKVNVSDITTLQLQLAGEEVITGELLEHTDFDGDGSFDINDVSELQNMISGVDFECYQKMDSSYKNIPQSRASYNYTGETKGVVIESEKICYTDDYIMTVDDTKRDSVKGYFLITSKEQFCDLFKAESPEFEDEFFKDNALFVMLKVMDVYDDIGVNNFTVDGNKLLVYDYEVDTLWEYGKDCCKNKIFKLNKADIENVTEITYYTANLGQ